MWWGIFGYYQIVEQQNASIYRWFLFVNIPWNTAIIAAFDSIFAVPQMLNVRMSPFMAEIIAFSMNSSAYFSEIIRSGVQSISSGQFEIAKVLGFSRFQIMKDIILPQGIRNALPALVNEMVDLIKESAIISVIGEEDLLRRANAVASEHYLYLEPLLAAGVCYYFLIMVMSGIAKLKNLCCKFGTNNVLNGVSFSVDGGQIATIIGKSGAGKTTIIRILIKFFFF